MENLTIISIEGLKKHFSMSGGKFTALNGIDLEFRKGEFTGVVGPSGSGKTTLLNIIGSLDSPSEGKAIVLGQSIGREKEAQTARDVFWNEIEEWKRKERERKPSDNESLVEELRKDVSDIQDICASKDRRNESLVEELRKECDMWKAKAEEMMAEWKAEVKTISTKVYVVMGNDYPDEVFANEIAAELYCKMQRDERPTAGVTLGRRIYWRVYPFTVKGRQT